MTVLLAVVGPLSAQQSNAERILSGRDTPPRDFDLIHQRIEVANFDWNAVAFDGNVTTTVVSLRPGLDSIVLAMGRRLEVRTVTLNRAGAVSKPGSGRPPVRQSAQFTRPGDSIVVRLPKPVGFRDTVRFTIDYRGRITQGRGLYFFKAEPGRPRHPQQVYSGGGTDGNPNWIPTYAAPNDKATWDLVARVPATLTVVSNGRLVSDRPDPPARAAGKAAARTHTVHWRQEQPASTYLISLAAAPFRKVSDRWRNVPLDYYVYPEDVALARRLFGVTADMMETFTRLTGMKYPWVKYSQATVTDFIGGMENVGATTLVDWLPDARAYRDRPWYRQSLIPHELAHQWFGNLVTTENWSNYWLNEGLAEFMAGQYWGAKQGRQAEDDFYLDEYDRFLTAESRRSVPLASFNSNNVYTKGALVMQMLKKHLGPERFWASINRYLTRHAYGNASTDDLRRAVLHATGQNLHWFWDQWIYQAGYPRFTVVHALDSAVGALTLTVRQTQVDSARADSGSVHFSTPLVFQGPVTVRVGTAAGDVRKRVRLDRREQVITIEGLKGRPNMVVFDENNAMLKSLTFEQPTPWLANQLARDPDLWNRNWVISQLAQRTGDSLAAAALARAARTADYYLTRAQAVGALARFPASVATPVVTAALRDTSAVVRATAVSVLGAVGGPASQAAALTAWKRDSSYEVRANALLALSRIDSVGSRPQVLAGLSTPSYRDVIQSAAIVAAARAPDSTLIDGLEKILGDQERPAIVLATLASEGDTRALTALVRHRDDLRPWVRRWVLDAIERSLEKTP
ncbi:MAG TPA: M1 family metallopeptidase [Gemmatimonadales bacterium]|nr:M1 family metallopeptidase [Gemmatimonadales bacterium]